LTHTSRQCVRVFGKSRGLGRCKRFGKLKLKKLRPRCQRKELTKDEELEIYENELKRLREGKRNPQRIIYENELEVYLSSR
jgi:hypothetical protein